MESLVRKCLYLLGHGLNEEIVRNEKEAGHFFQFTQKANHFKIFDVLMQMSKEPTLASHHEMIKWIKDQCALINPELMRVMGQAEEPTVPLEDEVSYYLLFLVLLVQI